MSATPLPRPAPAAQPASLLLWALALLVCVVAWDAAGQDLAAAHWFGSSAGFPLRNHWLLVQVMHEGARHLAWALTLALVLGVWWPWGVLRRLTPDERLQMAASTLIALAVVSLTKNLSTTSCPWDLAEFGGVARYASHWALGVVDGGSGRCFPAGHASAGFAFVGGYFALRRAGGGPVVAGRCGGGRVRPGWGAADARRALHEPHAVDRLAVLGRGFGLRGGQGCTAPAAVISSQIGLWRLSIKR